MNNTFLTFAMFEANLTQGDFWKELFEDSILQWILGPISIISMIILIPAYLAIFYYIYYKDIK